MKAFTLSDFGGGLNTSYDESLLPANMTADLRNADPLDSLAIRRRQGYRDHAEIGDGGSVLALHRFYRTDGEKFWFAAVEGSGAATSITQDTGELEYTTTDGGGPPANVYVRQSFTPASDTAFEDYSFEVVTNASVSCSGSLRDATGTTAYATASTTLTEDGTATIAPTSFTNGFDGILRGGTTYIISLTLASTGTCGIKYAASNPYSGGTMYTRSSTVWSEFTGYDARFSVNGTVYGGDAMLRQDATTEVPVTTLEAESTSFSGGSATAYTSDYPSSGGRIARVSTSATFVLPYSTKITVKGGFGSIGASLNVDGGSWVSVTGSTHTFSSLSGTTHTIGVKAAARNAYCIRTRPLGDRATSILSRQQYATAPCAIGESVERRVSMMFYDPDGAEGEDIDANIRVTGGTAQEVTGGIGLYQHPTLGSDTRYFATGVGAFRTRGRDAWHTVSMTIRFTRTSLYGGTLDVLNPLLDGSGTGLPQSLASGDIDFYSTIVFGVYTRRYGTGSVPIWFDTYRVNGALEDDHVGVSGWTEGGTSTTYPMAIDSLQKDTERRIDIDSFVYSALGDFTSIGSVSASAGTVGVTTMNNQIHFGTGYDALRYTTGASATTLSATNTTYPAFLVENKRRLFSAGKYDDNSLLNYTAVDDPDNWTGGGSLYLAGKDSAGPCTGLAVWDNVLFFFTSSRIYALDTTGTDSDWVSKTLHTRYGCVAPKSLASSANGVVFLSDDGVRAYGYIQNVASDDGSGIILLSANITPTIEGITNKSIACGTVFKNRYWLSCALDGATTNNAILVCDLERRTENGQPVWTRYDIADVTCFETTRGDEYGLYAGTSDGKIVQLDYGDTDNGAPIPMRYDVPPLPVGGYQNVKHFRHVHVLGSSDTTQIVTFTPETDDVDGQTVQIPLDESTAFQPVRRNIAARGRYIKARIASDGANQPVTISSLTFTYRPDSRMR